MTRAELALVLGTRLSLFVGLGLVLANCFSSAEKRSAVGQTLLATGLFTGACLASQIFGSRRPFKLTFGTDAYDSESQFEPRRREKTRRGTRHLKHVTGSTHSTRRF
jgi:hypothetical protein